MSKMREQFEAWHSSKNGWEQRHYDFYWNETYYEDEDFQCAWECWQASREAVVIELPEPGLPEEYLDEGVDRDSEEFRYLEARHGAQYQTYRKCQRAIEAQGFKCK